MDDRKHRFARTAVVATAALAAACGDGGGPAPGSPTTTAAAPGPTTATVPDLGAPEEIAKDLTVPWGLAFLPGGDALVTERDTGRVLRVPAGGGQGEEVYRVPGVVAGGEGGLLGLALSPRHEQDDLVYVYYTAATDNRIARFALDDDAAPEVIFDGLAKAGFHNGGRIAFGPDGMLYVGTGDAGQESLAQDPRSPNGKILRLTPEGEPAQGNPTDGSPVYTLGHRNIEGLAWDADGRLYATEFGADRWDEVNLIQPGANYGWPEVEGRGDAGGRFTDPLVTWRPDEASPAGATITGGTLYVAALAGRRLWTMPVRDGGLGEPRAELRDDYGRLRTVAVAPDGALWLTTSNTDGRGDPRSGDDRILRFPTRGSG